MISRYETTELSMHIVNAVSPGFTCAWSFAKLLADAIENPAGSKAPGSRRLKRFTTMQVRS